MINKLQELKEKLASLKREEFNISSKISKIQDEINEIEAEEKCSKAINFFKANLNKIVKIKYHDGTTLIGEVNNIDKDEFDGCFYASIKNGIEYDENKNLITVQRHTVWLGDSDYGNKFEMFESSKEEYNQTIDEILRLPINKLEKAGYRIKC